MSKQSSDNEQSVDQHSKDKQLNQYRVTNAKEQLTTNNSLHVSNDEGVLRAGERGPTLHEDFHYYEKITHFVREEIPERKVHARGYGAHGEFECYQSMKELTKAGFLQEPGKKTPVLMCTPRVRPKSNSRGVLYGEV